MQRQTQKGGRINGEEHLYCYKVINLLKAVYSINHAIRIFFNKKPVYKKPYAGYFKIVKKLSILCVFIKLNKTLSINVYFLSHTVTY